MQVSIFVFNGFTALDAIGPYEALQRLPEVQVSFCALEPGQIDTVDGAVKLVVDRSIFDIANPDIIIFAGGSGKEIARLLQNIRLLDRIRELSDATTYTTSVCTGAFFVAAAGLLNAQFVSTHWRAKGALAKFGAKYSTQRVTRSGKFLSSSGVSAGIELGLVLCGLIAGDDVAAAVELSMEYSPVAPFGGLQHDQASDETRRLVVERLRQ
ncbi:MAG: DJ-1/PfpI family protein [Betaproteobacteria bacterium]|nr:MAG: DJ-1/PfpI family protein [Betaproteobacteria bacterium]